MNSIFTIKCYKLKNVWYFDDKERGIVREPFVLGSSELIEFLLRKKGFQKKNTCTLAFSESYIPEYDARLIVDEYTRPLKVVGSQIINNRTLPKYEEDMEKEPESAYYLDESGKKCWLCPAQLKYFGKVAPLIYAKILDKDKPKKRKKEYEGID